MFNFQTIKEKKQNKTGKRNIKPNTEEMNTTGSMIHRKNKLELNPNT